ncbi:MAG: hypothetical protein ABJG47_06160 [Ekhidna sp.]
MQKLALHYDEMLQGEFSLKELNFLFAFQVNCPGCFAYGIPAVNSLYEEFKDKVAFLGLSTAFEDFEFNNEKNTTALLKSSEIVGETKSYFAKQGYHINPLSLDFPVAMDSTADEQLNVEDLVHTICKTNPNFDFWPIFEQKQLQRNVRDYLEKQEKISLTFTLNQLRGTPTFMVFNQEMEILAHNFGHLMLHEMKHELETRLSQSN